MELGRIMIVTGGEHLSPIRRSWLTKIFVVGDVISFLVQAGGQAHPYLVPKFVHDTLHLPIH